MINFRTMTARLLSTVGVLADGTGLESPLIRSSPYNELGVSAPMSGLKHLLADEGSYFVATNPTPGTALADAVNASFSDTASVLIYGAVNAGQLKKVFLDYIKLIVTTAPASAVNAYFAITRDVAARSLTTNHVSALTPVNQAGAGSAMGTLNAQNSATASAYAASSGSSVVLARGSFGGLPVVGDELVIACGSPSAGSYPGLTAAQATCPGRKVSGTPPIVVPPGFSFSVDLWFPSNAVTGLSYELEMGWIER